MQQRRLGRSGLSVSCLGLGTWLWGQDTDEHEAKDALTAFVDAGGTLVDTAASYGDGASERVLGGLIDKVVARDELVIATKAGLGTRRGEWGADTSRGGLLRQLDGSLHRLGLDEVDLWQVHVWSRTAPWQETLSALDYAVSSGRARYVGISNWSGWQTGLGYAWQAAAPGRAPLVSTQVEYSLLNRAIEDEVLPAARALGMGVLAWSPLGRGVLTGKYRAGVPADSRAATPHLGSNVEPYLDEGSHGIVEAVVRAADGLGLSPIQTALAWVLARPGLSSALVGARTTAQLTASLDAWEVELPQEIVDALDDVSDEGADTPS
ncbi:MAG TPA: aldo/keto reductase [Nocardioidaceae bacterium]|nr:aldo/keto reductase [Nocardioidaceae bacterium]